MQQRENTMPSLERYLVIWLNAKDGNNCIATCDSEEGVADFLREHLVYEDNAINIAVHRISYTDHMRKTSIFEISAEERFIP